MKIMKISAIALLALALLPGCKHPATYAGARANGPSTGSLQAETLERTHQADIQQLRLLRDQYVKIADGDETFPERWQIARQATHAAYTVNGYAVAGFPADLRPFVKKMWQVLDQAPTVP